MNSSLLICFSFALLFSSIFTASAASLKTATVTRIINDVRLLPLDRAPETAKPGDIVSGSTGIATGDQSRAELKFPDNTLTRLGSNSVFRLESNSRTVELEEGVILIQVPKQLGGARVRTAAVTAAITGTTVLIEFIRGGFFKLIVVEGEVDLFFNDKPGNFITLQAGEMIIMKADAKNFPLPVKVDLARLAKTSKLMDNQLFGPLGNQKQIQDALGLQDKLKNSGELTASAFVIEGRGTMVSLTQEARAQIARTAGLTVRASQPNPPGPGGPEPLIVGTPLPNFPVIPGLTYIDESTTISTNPRIQAFNSLSEGRIDEEGAIYNPYTDGPIQPLLGGPPEDATIRRALRSAGNWSVFRFEELEISSTPSVNSTAGPRNLLLAAGGDVNFTYIYYEESDDPGAFTIGADLDSLAVLSTSGSITMAPETRINGSGSLLVLDAFDANSDVTINGLGLGGEGWLDADDQNISLKAGRALIQAGRDIILNNATVVATSVGLKSGRDVTVTGSSGVGALNKVDISAGRNVLLNSAIVRVADSEDLWQLAQTGPSQLNINAQTGDISVEDSSLEADLIGMQSRGGSVNLVNSSIFADVIKARTLSPNGTITINGSTLSANSLIRLFATGSNGSIRFTGDSNLYGPQVDLAAKTVTVNPGVNVTVDGGVRVFTDNAQYSNAGNLTQGTFRDTESQPVEVSTQSFKSRPRY